MKQQVLSPRVQDREEADLRAKMLGIGSDLRQGFGDGAEQQVVEFDGVLPDQRVEIVRQRKDDVKVTRRQKLLFPGRDPALASLGLALGTMTIAAGVERDAFFFIAAAVPARVLRTLVDMTAECGGAATRDRTHDLELLKSEPVSMAVDETVSLRAKNVGHLYGGPRHGLFVLPDSGISSSLEREMVSMGLSTDSR